MDKRKIVLKILKDLFWIWELAEWLYCLISSQYITDQSIDWLIIILNNSLKNFEKDINYEKMQNAIKKLNKLKEKEQLLKDIEEKEILIIEKQLI